MKGYFLLPLVCLLGFLAGSWGPREELRAFREKQQQEAREKPRNVQEEINGFTQMMNIPAVAKRPHRRRETSKPLFRGATNAVPAQVKAEVKAEAAATNAVPQPRPQKLSPEDLRARIEEAQDLWATRVEIARTQWKGKLKLEGAAAERFDAVLDEMNVKLYETSQTLVAMLADKDAMTPELGFRLMGDASTVMAETYEKIAACAAPEQREVVSELPVTDFIDPGVAEPLIDVQGKLRNFRPMGVRRK